jgi:hypothetical protein
VIVAGFTSAIGVLMTVDADEDMLLRIQSEWKAISWI